MRSHSTALHEHLTETSSAYAAWHTTTHHKKVHRAVFHGHNLVWAVIAAVVFGQAIFGNVYAATATKAVSAKEEWEQGTLSNLETDDPSGDLKLKSSGTWGTRTIKTPPQTINTGAAGVFYDNKLYAFRGNLDNDFYAYDASKNTWNTLAEAPVGVGVGAHLTSDGAGNLYAIFGGYNKFFYKYSIAGNTWSKLAELSDITGPGSSIVFADDKVYLLRANNSQDFFVYDIATAEWGSANILPKAAGAGAGITYDGSRYIYAMRGNGATYTTALYRFDTQAPAWVLMTTGAGMPTVNYQRDIKYVSGKLYMQQGNSTTGFHTCTISGTTCTTSATTAFPATTNSGVLAYNPVDSLLYSLRGLNTYDFYRFNPSNNTFVGSPLFGQPASVTPIGFTTGADLIYDGTAGIYGLKGGAAASGFYYYNIAAGTWTARTITGLPALSYDTKAVKAGNFIYLFMGNSANFYAYNTTNDALGWVAKTAAPAAVSNGASLAYPGSGDLLYALRGSGTNTFYAYSIANNNWTTLDPTDLPAGVLAKVGARLVATASDVYAIIGNGNTAFYKYSIAGNSWSQVGRTPFSPYYGTDITASGNKIYALAGNYSFATYEYENGAWRKLADIPKYSQTAPVVTYDAGSYNGASIELAGANGIFVERGNGSAEVLNLVPGSSNYVASGTYESQVFDLTHVTGWNSLSSTVTLPAGTSVILETKTSIDNVNWSAWSETSGSNITSSPARYLQVRATLNASGDQLLTPILSSLDVSYTTDGVNPGSPTAVQCFSAQIGGVELTSGSEYKYNHPYCTWSGATDGESGIAGYYVYVGSNQIADPANLSSGSFYTSSTGAIVNNLVDTGNNYVRIKTKDNAGNVSDTAFEGFVYNYTGVAPISSVTKTATADFTGESTGLTAANNELKLNTKAGFWKESRLTPAPTAASAASMVVKGDIIYEARGNSVTFDSYNASTDTWNSPNPADLPVALAAGGRIENGPGNYIYAIRGGAAATQNFYRFDGTNWTDLSSVAPIPGTISTYASSTYDGSRYIYVMRGNGDDGFYRYDTQGTNGQWTTRSNVNFGYPNQTSSVAPDAGSNLASDGADTLYAIKGYSAGGFAKYTASTNTWTPLSSLPMIPYSGASINYDSITNSLIFVPGYNSNKLYSYNVATGDWTARAKSIVPFTTGTASVIYNGNLYTIRGGTTAFYQYNIAKDTWYAPTVGLFGANYQGRTNYFFGTGSAVTKDNNQNLYMLRGSLDNSFVRYNTKNGTTTRMPNFPTGSYDGASLTYVASENAIYGVAGLSDRSLFRYDIAANVWSEKTTDLVPAAAPTGAGTSLTWDGGQYLYYVRGVGTNAWYRYDLSGADGSRWSTPLSLTGLTGVTFGGGSEAVIKDGRMYVMRGQGLTTFYTIDLAYAVSGGTWSQLQALTSAVNGDGFLMDGNDGYLYLIKGNTTNEFYRYKIGDNVWSRVANVPSVIYGGTTNGGANGVTIDEKFYTLPGNTVGVGAYNDGLMTYINQTADTSFTERGVYTSDTIDLVKNYSWANLTSAFVTKTNTNVVIETASSDDNTNWSPWVSVSDEKIISGATEYVINSPVARYVKIRATLTSTDGVYSPTVDYIKVNYYKDETAPSNPLSLASALSKQTGGNSLVNAAWTNTVEPYFTLPVEDATGGATDSVGGSGVDCYFVYFGTDQSATPSSQSSCTTALSYGFSPSENGETYYLLVQTRDKAGNLQGGIQELFSMKFDLNPPTDPADLAVNPEGYTNVDSYTFTISEPANDPESAARPTIQYRTGGDVSGVWYDFPAGQSVTIPNEQHPQGKYRAGINEFFIRVKDTAGNVSPGTKTIQYKFGAVAPSPPASLVASPTTSTQNDFTFTWDAPVSYIGDVNRITYYYSINTEPTEYNTNSTTARAAGPGPFATQRGENNFFVVAKDEAGNIDWRNFSKVPFTAETSAPAAPTDVSVNDISDKDANQYRLVISWIAPTIGDVSNFAGYDIYESDTEEGEYAKLANTSGTAYVHTGLVKDSRHFYTVKSVDKTNNVSVASTSTPGTASGRYKKAPNVVQAPEVTAKAKSAIVKWATSREANTTIEYGKTESLGRIVSNPLVNYVTDHEITVTGLDPGTKYYFKAYFTDPDGNIGNAELGSFVTAPAPVISGLKVEDVSLDSMLITWYSNVPSYGSILYGKTQSLSSSIEEDAFFTKQHVVKITDLEEGTKYFTQIKALDEEGNLFTSDIYENETLPLPRVSNVKLENLKNVDSPTITISYDTNVETSTYVQYSSDGFRTKEAVQVALTKKHEIQISDLSPMRGYTLKIGGRDRFGNEAVPESHAVTTLSDTMPPRIEKVVEQKKIIGEGQTAETQLTVKINTNEASTAVVQAEKGVGASNFSINSNEDALNTGHTITLKLGEPGIPYSYRVKVRDIAGNETVSEIKTLVVSSPKKSVLEYIVTSFTRNFGWMTRAFK